MLRSVSNAGRLAASLWLASACGDAGVESLDQEVADLADDRPDTRDAAPPLTIAMPEAPRPPDLRCGEWPGRDAMGVAYCEPPGERMRCPSGEARFLEDADCGPVEPCPSTAFREGLPPDTVYVTPDGRGRGSESDPTDLQTALREGASSIALSAGVFVGSFDLPNGTELIGHCAGDTVLRVSTGAAGAARIASGRRGALRHLRIEGAGAVGLIVQGEGEVENLLVEDAAGVGVIVAGGRLRANGLAVKGTVPLDGSGGPGVIVQDGRIEGARWFLSDNVSAGLRMDGGEADVQDLVSVGNRAFAPATMGQAVLSLGANVSIDGADLRFAMRSAVRVDGGSFRLRRARVGEALAVEGLPPADLVLARNAQVDIAEAVFDGVTGVLVVRDGEDTQIRDSVFLAAPDFVEGAQVSLFLTNTPVHVERVVVVGGEQGMLVTGPPSFDVILPGEEPPEEEESEPIPLLVSDFRALGVGRTGPWTSLTIDAPVVGSVVRAAIEMGRVLAIGTSSPDLRLEDVSVRGTRVSERGYAAALLLNTGARVEGSRISVSDTRDIAIQVLGAEATFSDLSIARAEARACDPEEFACRRAPGGVGLGVFSGAQVSGERVEIRGAALCGAQVARDGSRLRLRDAVVAESAIGVCVQVDGFDVREVTDATRFVDNETNVETTDHAIPSAPPPPSFSGE